MSHFYASIQGSRGEATRQGTQNSGMDGHIRGWNIGARVSCHVDSEGRDVVSVTITGGSSGYKGSQYLGQWYRDDDGELVHDRPEHLPIPFGTMPK